MTLDGNVLGGPLAELFTVDVTTAIATCAGCGQASAVATLVAYTDAPGLVARCPHCEDVVLRVVRAPRRAYLDLRGARVLEILLPS
jgi:hypothetical protein